MSLNKWTYLGKLEINTNETIASLKNVACILFSQSSQDKYLPNCILQVLIAIILFMLKTLNDIILNQLY